MTIIFQNLPFILIPAFLLALILIAVFIVRNKRSELPRVVDLVKQHSMFYKEVIELNSRTEEYTIFSDNGHPIYEMSVDSKREYDRIGFKEALSQLLHDCHDDIVCTLYCVQDNRRIFKSYCDAFDNLHSTITPEVCQNLRIPYKTFLEHETQLVAEAKLRMVQEVSVTCVIEYRSPQGRNHYSKSYTFEESELRIALQEIAAKKETQEKWEGTEVYRRKAERAKVTPSLRYNILKRDGFRCRLCGRSAQSGVELEVDHIIPISKGGTTTYSNLQTLCRACNRGKGAKL